MKKFISFASAVDACKSLNEKSDAYWCSPEATSRKDVDGNWFHVVRVFKKDPSAAGGIRFEQYLDCYEEDE